MIATFKNKCSYFIYIIKTNKIYRLFNDMLEKLNSIVEYYKVKLFFIVGLKKRHKIILNIKLNNMYFGILKSKYNIDIK